MKALSLNLARWICCKNQATKEFGDPWIQEKNNRNLHIIPDDSVVYFRKEVFLNTSPENAVVTASALGIFELFVNGVRVGSLENGKTVYDELKPGSTDYRKRVLSFTYDISSLLKEGKNTLSIVVSRGWWSGSISFGCFAFKKVAAIASFEISLDDGKKVEINTDASWETTLEGPVRYADIYDGEYFDARIEYPFNRNECESWENCEIFDSFDGEITPAEAPFIRVREHLSRSPFSAVVYDGTKDNGSDYGEINTVYEKFAEDCAEVATMDKEPKLDGRHMTMFLSCKQNKESKNKDNKK